MYCECSSLGLPLLQINEKAPPKLWPRGKVPYAISSAIVDDGKAVIILAIVSTGLNPFDVNHLNVREFEAADNRQCACKDLHDGWSELPLFWTRILFVCLWRWISSDCKLRRRYVLFGPWKRLAYCLTRTSLPIMNCRRTMRHFLLSRSKYRGLSKFERNLLNVRRTPIVDPYIVDAKVWFTFILFWTKKELRKSYIHLFVKNTSVRDFTLLRDHPLL